MENAWIASAAPFPHRRNSVFAFKKPFLFIRLQIFAVNFRLRRNERWSAAQCAVQTQFWQSIENQPLTIIPVPDKKNIGFPFPGTPMQTRASSRQHRPCRQALHRGRLKNIANRRVADMLLL
ncbi:hypothetical protein [Neisseria sp.]|uniref:hypothetical protein n=1 Tax=Neisseria sp. TaxID=192066 RepID=UPI00359FD154